MKKKDIQELIDMIHGMDNHELLMNTLGAARREELARYLMHPDINDIAEKFTLYVGSLINRLETIPFKPKLHKQEMADTVREEAIEGISKLKNTLTKHFEYRGAINGIDVYGKIEMDNKIDILINQLKAQSNNQ